jgi:hypothetical protein
LKKKINVSGLVQPFVLKLAPAERSVLHRIRGHVSGGEYLSTPSHVTLSGTSLMTPTKATIHEDGLYEFKNVRAGTYTLKVGESEPATVVVADRDLHDVNLRVPAVRELRGRVTVKSDGPLPNYSIWFAREPEGRLYAARPAPDGSFRAILPEGEYRLRFPEFPTDLYQIESVSFGSVDVLKDPLRILGTRSEEMLVTLIATRPAVRVIGRVKSESRNGPEDSVILSGNAILLRTTKAPDGSFEFAKVPPGVYTAHASGFSGRITITDQDVLGLEFPFPLSSPLQATPGVSPDPDDRASQAPQPLPATLARLRGRVTAEEMPSTIRLTGDERDLQAQVDSNGQFEFTRVPVGLYSVYTNPLGSFKQVILDPEHSGSIDFNVPGIRKIRGRVVVEGGSPLPHTTIKVVVPGKGKPGEDVRRDGTFVLSLPDGEYDIELAGFPAAYRVQSIQYGSIDLLQQKLKVTGTNAEEILVRLEVVQAVPWVRVAGHVTDVERLPASAKVVLDGPSIPLFIDAAIDASGNFVLPKVPSGVYALRTEPPVYRMAPRTVVVEDRDITVPDLVVPEQRLVTVRIRLQERGSVPGMVFNLKQPDGTGFRFFFTPALRSPIMYGRTDYECVSDVCFPAPAGRLLNEPAAIPDASTPETFTLKLPDGDYRMRIESVSQGTLQALTYGSTNLLKESFTLTGFDIQDIVITLLPTVPR